jgi:hypothetical protein
LALSRRMHGRLLEGSCSCAHVISPVRFLFWAHH